MIVMSERIISVTFFASPLSLSRWPINDQMLDFDAVTLASPMFCQAFCKQPPVTFLRSGLGAKQGYLPFKQRRVCLLENLSLLHQLQK